MKAKFVVPKNYKINIRATLLKFSIVSVYCEKLVITN